MRYRGWPRISRARFSYRNFTQRTSTVTVCGIGSISARCRGSEWVNVCNLTLRQTRRLVAVPCMAKTLMAPASGPGADYPPVAVPAAHLWPRPIAPPCTALAAAGTWPRSSGTNFWHSVSSAQAPDAVLYGDPNVRPLNSSSSARVLRAQSSSCASTRPHKTTAPVIHSRTPLPQVAAVELAPVSSPLLPSLTHLDGVSSRGEVLERAAKHVFASAAAGGAGVLVTAAFGCDGQTDPDRTSAAMARGCGALCGLLAGLLALAPHLTTRWSSVPVGACSPPVQRPCRLPRASLSA